MNRTDSRTNSHKMVIIKGKGTAKEERTTTNIDLYPLSRHGKIIWVTVPQD